MKERTKDMNSIIILGMVNITVIIACGIAYLLDKRYDKKTEKAKKLD